MGRITTKRNSVKLFLCFVLLALIFIINSYMYNQLRQGFCDVTEGLIERGEWLSSEHVH